MLRLIFGFHGKRVAVVVMMLAIESFVAREMFGSFLFLSFSLGQPPPPPDTFRVRLIYAPPPTNYQRLSPLGKCLE